MNPILLEPELRLAAPSYKGRLICCDVRNNAHPDALWAELDEETERFRQRYELTDINRLPGIFEMRNLYKRLGKDPNRYRPSAEALCRRILLHDGLYRINALVDLINLVSVRTGFSIGGFDADKVQGDVRMGVGKPGEPFEAIGRGMLNIKNMPVYRDEVGCIGSPTSDVERTKLTLETARLLMVLHSAEGAERLDEAVQDSVRLLESHASAVNFQILDF